jgi:hypothetical protein
MHLDFLTSQNQTTRSLSLVECSQEKDILRVGRSVRYDRRLRKPKPAVSALPFDNQNVDWGSFRVFLKERCSSRVIEDRVRYAQKSGKQLKTLRDFFMKAGGKNLEKLAVFVGYEKVLSHE